jgi:hypothetical protein
MGGRGAAYLREFRVHGRSIDLPVHDRGKDVLERTSACPVVHIPVITLSQLDILYRNPGYLNRFSSKPRIHPKKTVQSTITSMVYPLGRSPRKLVDRQINVPGSFWTVSRVCMIGYTIDSGIGLSITIDKHRVFINKTLSILSAYQ